MVTNQLRSSPSHRALAGNHLVSKGKPWSRKRSKDHLGQWTLPTVRSWAGSRRGAPAHHGRHEDTPTNPRGVAPALPSAGARVRIAQPRATLRSWDGASKEEPPTRFAQPRATLRSWGGASKEVHPTRKQIDGSDAMKSFWQRKVLGMQGPPQKRAAYAAPTGVRFPRTSLTCHSEDFGCTE